MMWTIMRSKERASMTMRSFKHGLGLALMMGRLVLDLLWASIEESRLDRPKSSFVGLSLMVHVS